ncbi:hypothetical protein L596_014221 [Steinernema carpocapsae]|uniref:Uncharacterized protein n=1 Tax=Steinernema carpocapsae TaxID=34508 RepID=A0A4U5NC36_STECR|nr:hypothetical protein L596_014221 [Steinernema carpocapsae]
MDSLYHKTNAQLQEVHFTMGKLEQAKDEAEAQAIIGDIQLRMRSIDEACQRLDLIVSKEAVQKRQNAKYKVDQLKFDCRNVHTAMGSVFTRLTNRWRATAEREELLTQRFRANEPTALTIDDAELLINDGMHRSHRGVDNLIDQGQAVLESLRHQHNMLRGVKGKIMTWQDAGTLRNDPKNDREEIRRRLDHLRRWLRLCLHIHVHFLQVLARLIEALTTRCVDNLCWVICMYKLGLELLFI